MKRVLVIAPHADDETLGCGGTLSRLGAEGVELHWALMTRMSLSSGHTDSQVRDRAKEISAVAARYKFKETHELGFPTTRLDAVPLAEVAARVGQVLSTVEPDTVFLPHRGDIHSDHRVTFDASLGCLKHFRHPYIERVLMYETISETDLSPAGVWPAFAPNSFGDITGHLQKKLAVFALYKGEGGSHPFPRNPDNIRALATSRGAQAGFRYAEAFQLLLDRW